MIPCFLVERCGRSRVSLRRWSDRPCPRQTGPNGYCDACEPVGEIETRYERRKGHELIGMVRPQEYVFDGRWPALCATCATPFAQEDHWQVGQDLIWRAGDGREWVQSELPDGAMFDAFWLNDVAWATGEDGRSMICVVPNGRQWLIDGPASNCTRPGEPHKCWVRHGEPPALTVDKAGDSCSAGAGSIQTRDWHGFLRAGQLTVA